MKDKPGRIRSIPIANLLIDLQNPRYDPRTNQREAIATIANDQGAILANLAEDIVEKGLNPSELPIVTPSDDARYFVVLEGNRRIAALKLLLSPSLASSIGLPDSIVKRYKAVHEHARRALPKKLDCVVLSREESNHWIYIRHTGESEGVGIVPWDGVQTHRFRGASPAFQAIQIVKQSGYLDEDTQKKLPKISITNIERVLGTPGARKHLGVNVKDRQLIIVGSDADVVPRLARMVSDVAHKNIKVGDIETKEDRISYAQTVAANPLPKADSVTSAGRLTAPGSVASRAASKPSGKRIAPDRTTVIPKRFVLAIDQPRLNRIYHELQKLDTNNVINSCAVMLRVFVELSIDEFAKRHKLSLKETPKSESSAAGSSAKHEKDMTLRTKLSTVADYLEKQNKCSRAELKGVRILISNRNHVLSVDTLNAYVHNRDYSPTASDIKATWDNLQVFVERIWTV
jgi:hypothetical protein